MKKPGCCLRQLSGFYLNIPGSHKQMDQLIPVLSANNEPIGFGNLLIFGDVGWMGNIVVKKEFRGKGLGTSITKYKNVIGNQNVFLAGVPDIAVKI